MARVDAIADLHEWSQLAQDTLMPLPASVYTSAALYELERDSLFGKAWVCVGHVSELEEPGDYLTTDVVHHPVLVVRDDTGIRAFSNVCRHRGTVLANGCGKKTRFVCPYHAWTYDLSGKLLATPYLDDERLNGIRLPEYRVETWQGLVFVNLDTNAAPLADGLSALDRVIPPYRFPEYRVIHREDAEVACNWKILVENFCESYHVFRVHKSSFQSEIPSDSTEIQPGGTGFNHHTQKYRDVSKYPADQLARLPVELQRLAHLICVYPCLVLSIDFDVAVWLSVRPTSPTTLKYTAQVALFPDGDGEVKESRAAEHIAAFNEFMPEDKAVIEQVQRGVTANVGNAGVLHPWERTNWEFGHYLARQIRGATNDRNRVGS